MDFSIFEVEAAIEFIKREKKDLSCPFIKDKHYIQKS